MKPRRLSLIRDSAPWLWLLLLGDFFFMFLAWLAYPEKFPFLAGLMAVFTLGCAGMGLLIAAKKRRKQEAAFQRFLAEPSMGNEAVLIETSDCSHENMIRALGEYLREQQNQLAEYGHEVSDFQEFIEAWVHEMKTPLSLVTLLLVNRKGEMSEEVYKRFEHARRELSEEVDRILYYAREKADHIDYRYNRISLSVCCSEVLEDLESLFEERAAVIHQNVGDMEVVSDMKTLQFIITQIILNSIKYTEAENFPMITLESGVDTDQKRCFLKISDRGIGVPAADLPFIFDKGFTGNHPNHQKATGLGLYLVKRFCDALQIGIEVESHEGQGLAISLFFPVVAQD